MPSPVYASVLSLTSMEPLLFWPAVECDRTGIENILLTKIFYLVKIFHLGYSGCTDARKAAAGPLWGRGKESLALSTRQCALRHI